MNNHVADDANDASHEYGKDDDHPADDEPYQRCRHEE
jgi:hypothetical protein